MKEIKNELILTKLFDILGVTLAQKLTSENMKSVDAGMISYFPIQERKEFMAVNLGLFEAVKRVVQFKEVKVT